MSRRSLLTLLALALVVASVAALGWYVLSDSNQAPPRAVAPGMTVEPAVPAGPAAPIASAKADEAPAERSKAADPSSESRSSVATLGEDELSQALWVSGVVRFPDGTPLGETVFVEADGKSFRHRDNHRVQVEPDGSFRVAFAKGSRTGTLKLVAQHLYLEPPHKVKLSDASERVELAPLLGGRIVGKAVPPAGAEDPAKTLVGMQIELHGWHGIGLGDGVQVRRTCKVGEDLAYALDGIPPGVDCTLMCDPKVWVSFNENEIEVAAGASRTLDLAFELGARISGKVLDSSGAPVADAQVSAEVQPDSPDRWIWQQRTATSAADGTFELKGVSPGTLKLEATKKDMLAASHEAGRIANGDVKAGIELRLESGHFVAGRVQWADGRPAAGAVVRVVELDPSENGFSISFEMGRSSRTGADGTFRFLGLGAGPFEITASAASELEVDPSLTGLAAKRASKGPTLRDRIPEAKADTEVVLTLKPDRSVQGVVVDDLGQPIRRYTLVAAKDGSDVEFFMGGASQKVDSEDGAFVFEGLHEGSWKIIARAKGYHSNEPALATVPGNDAPLRIVLPRTAKLSGLVLDPDGQPAPKAHVSVEEQGDATPGMDLRIEAFGGSNSTDRTDSQGRFQITGSPFGKIRIKASSPTFAASEPLDLEVAPGQELKDLTLTLRRGGRVTGELHAAAGALAGREIKLDSSGSGWGGRDTTTDANGRFEFDHVDPGTYLVVAEPDSDEFEQMAADAGLEHDWELRQSLRQTATVKVSDGATEHVVLGAPARDPIRVTGVVRRGATAVEGAKVRFHFRYQPTAEESEALASDPQEAGFFLHSRQQTKFALTDAQGRYDVALENPGTYDCNVQGRDSGTATSRRVEIQGPSQTVDFELPAGRIAGRVLGPDGDPLQNVEVRLSRERAEAERDPSGIHGDASTDAEGAFAFADLPPGTYSVVAHHSWYFPRPQVEYSNARRDGLVIGEGTVIANVELRVSKAGGISGIVRTSSGAPASRVRLYARDENGRLSGESWRAERADESGRYRIGNLAPGSWTVTAVSEDEAVFDTTQVRVSAGSTEKLDLSLRRSTRIAVTVEEADGKRVGASLALVDARGVDQVEVLGHDSEGLGPVPPGRYVLRATNHSGESAQSELSLSGEELREVTLRFGGGD